MGAVSAGRYEHVPLVEIAIPKRRLAPVVVADLLPDFPRLATER